MRAQQGRIRLARAHAVRDEAHNNAVVLRDWLAARLAEEERKG